MQIRAAFSDQNLIVFRYHDHLETEAMGNSDLFCQIDLFDESEPTSMVRSNSIHGELTIAKLRFLCFQG